MQQIQLHGAAVRISPDFDVNVLTQREPNGTFHAYPVDDQ
jgi:hypothetical protein